MIRHQIEQGLFFLDSAGSQAVISLHQGAWPLLLHWGRPLGDSLVGTLPAFPNGYSVQGADKSFTPNRLPHEYPWGGSGDFRSPAFAARDEQGREAMDLVCRSWKIIPGRPDMGPLPAARTIPGENIETLIFDLEDPLTGLGVELRYTPMDGTLLRSVRFENRGTTRMDLQKTLSFSLDLHPDRNLEIIALDGAWARERQLRRFELPAGRWEAGSRRGVSSHQAWPGLVLAQADATESWGEAWGATLIWSGDWTMGVERDEDGGWRFQGGLHPDFHQRSLAPGASFICPEAVLVHSDRGLSGLSARYHDFVITRIMSPAWSQKIRPILANNWEATYWAFNQEKLLELADEAAACGVELFVLDDGWFGHRDDDRSSLGDWVPHPAKFPQGMRAFGEALETRGLGFGLWFEPEMVSPDSELYRNHPDWCLHMEGRPRSESRNQLVLDLTRQEVRTHVHQAVASVLRSAPISYVKWDMNRPFSHAGCDRYDWVLGLYALMEGLCTEFPDILFEGCCGGGGRMDLGLLYYMPQYWTSDNTDALTRLTIQEGMSLFLPPLAIGAHVSAVPNHQTGRITSLPARSRVAFAGNLGYELDFTSLTDNEKKQIRDDISWYKEHRALIQGGRFRRTRTSTGDRNTLAWQIHGQDGGEVLLYWFRPRAEANSRFPLYRFEGLEPEASYRATWYQERQESKDYTGAELMYRGLVIPLEGGDVDGVVVHLARRKS